MQNLIVFLQHFRENEINECGLDLYFATDMEVLGEVTQHELKEGGKDIEVNDENKDEYIEYVIFLSV